MTTKSRFEERIMALIDEAADSIAHASRSGPLDARMVVSLLVPFTHRVVQLAQLPPAAAELLANVELWRQQLVRASSPRKRSARIERLDSELAELHAALLREPAPDASPEQYNQFLEAIGHRLGRSVATLIVRLKNERKKRS